MVINKALLKHDISNFSLEILEYCEPADALDREDHYLKLLNPEYNILRKAGSSLGYKHREESKAKISASHMGRKRSLEDKANISASMFGKNNAKNQPSSQKIEVTWALELKTKTTFGSIREAARALNIRQSSISNYFALNQKTPFKKRYLLKKID